MVVDTSQAQNPMGRGQWIRWGRGMCEGWSLEIGMAFRGSVVRRETNGQPTTWIASINSTGLGEFLEREVAMRRVEELVESSMVLVLHDPIIVLIAAPFREMGSVNFAVSFYIGWPHSLDSEGRRKPPWINSSAIAPATWRSRRDPPIESPGRETIRLPDCARLSPRPWTESAISIERTGYCLGARNRGKR
jgi:hypothetical protein